MRLPGDDRVFRRAMPRLAVFCALLILVPGICNAAVAVLGGHAGMDHGIAASATPTPAHAHRPPDPVDADPVPGPAADDCGAHTCCAEVLKGTGRSDTDTAPVAGDLPGPTSTSRPPADRGAWASQAGWCPPGTPGLVATNAPLRR